MQSTSAAQTPPFATDAGGTSEPAPSRPESPARSCPPSCPPDGGHFTSVLTIWSVLPTDWTRGARPDAVALPSPTEHPSARTARPTTVSVGFVTAT
jgi:hypothetical protein